MKPAPFEYFDPDSVEEALALLEQHGDDAKILAGGQSLVPPMNMRLAKPRVIVDINRIRSLDYLREGEDGSLRIGALTRHATIERSEWVARRWPLLSEAVKHIGHMQIRFRGTVGGSIAHADPAAALPGVLAALGGEVVARGPGGERTIPAGEFFISYLTTSLEPTEMVVEVRLPPVPAGAGHAFMEIARRHGDFALVGVAALLSLDGNGRVGWARLALIGAGPTPIRAESAERVLVGQPPSEELFRAAGQAVTREVDPTSDIHASAEYRREVAGVLVRRALGRALERAAKG